MSSSPGFKFWDDKEVDAEVDLNKSVFLPPPPSAPSSNRQQVDAESWYGDDEEDFGPFGLETVGGQQPVRRQKRKRWGCGTPRAGGTGCGTPRAQAAGGGGRLPGPAAVTGGGGRPPLSETQRETLELGPRAVARSGFEQVPRSELGGELGRQEEFLYSQQRNRGTEEEFLYSSNWESDSSAAEEEREE